MKNNIITFVLLALLSIGWTLNPFFKKRAIGKLNSYQYLVTNSVIVSSFIIIFFIYRIMKGQDSINHIIKTINKTQFIWMLSGAIITFLTSLFLIILIKEHNVSYIIPHIQPLVIVLTILFGYFLFKESINRYQIIGIILVILGLIVINYKK